MASPIYAALEPLGGDLAGVPGPAELDERGCYARESVAEIEQVILASLATDLGDFVIPPLATMRSLKDDRWRLASCLQKATRYCLPDVAMAAANALYTSDRAYAVSRLGTILVEDVMLGAPLLVAQTLAMIGNTAWRRDLGERRLVVWIAGKAAEAAKDRSAVELAVLAEHHPALDYVALSRMADQDLAAWIADPDHLLRERIIASRILAGPYYGFDALPKMYNRSASALFRLMVEMGMNRWALYVAAKTASRLRDSMFSSMPIIAGWVGEFEPHVATGPVIERPMVGDILGAAYDKYTRPGLKALAGFSRASEMLPFMDAVPFAQRRYAIGVGVFLGEGGVLQRRLVAHPESEQVHTWVRSPERMRWLPESLAEEYLAAVRWNLGVLNDFRRSVVGEQPTQEPIWAQM